MLGYDEATNTIAYEGGIHTDGYGVYDAIAQKFGLRHGGCLAHTRRKFTDLGTGAPEITLPIFLHIQRIYQIEKQTRQTAAPPACRELIRRARSLPIAHELHEFILGHYKTQRPASNIGQALSYTLNQWSKILHCLSQGVMEIDTNLALEHDPPYQARHEKLDVLRQPRSRHKQRPHLHAVSQLPRPRS